MATDASPNDPATQHNKDPESDPITNERHEGEVPIWRRLLGGAKKTPHEVASSGTSTDGFDDIKVKPEKWSLGVLNPRETDEVPGTSTCSASRRKQEQ